MRRHLWDSSPRSSPGPTPVHRGRLLYGALGAPHDQHTAWLLAGFSNLEWGPSSLPYDLSVFGLPGCTAYTSADVAIPLSTVSGTAVWNIQIPHDPVVLGLSLFTQGFVPDTAANAFGAVVSNAVALFVGVQ